MSALIHSIPVCCLRVAILSRLNSILTKEFKMFMPETEDMLPRQAPRPCSSVPTGHIEEMVKPTVPEISLLFGQQPEHQVQQPQQQPQQQHPSASAPRPLGSFASWKKQILPRVNFSPILTTEIGSSQAPAITSSSISTAPTCSEYNYLPRTRKFDNNHTSPGQVTKMGYVGQGTAQYTRDAYPTEALVPSPRLANSNPATSDVLTICASTQTDLDVLSPTRNSLASVDLSNLANKQDMRQVLNILDMMRQEQQQLRHLYESLAQQQQQNVCSKTVKEIGTQCDISSDNKSNPTVKRTTPIVHDYIEEEDALPATYEAVKALPQFQSPRVVSPMAQSTGYRANTPKGRKSAGLMPTASNSPVLGTVLPKPSTEKSMVMNELALKYLPQRQINELMDEMRISPTTGNDVLNKAGTSPAPLRQIDNFTQSPSNISNASYKYLKKYRLLPEEQMSSPQAAHKMQRAGSPTISSPQSHRPMLDLDNIRNQPKLL